MRIDTHSVVYFINEEYGVVIRASGASKEVATWDKKRECFAHRLDLVTASFLARVDRYNGKWCAAHPTYSAIAARKAAMQMTASLPSKDGMRLAKAAKNKAMLAQLHECGAAAMCRKISEIWHEREAKYAEM